jgi:hypothetical protein
MHCPGCGAPLYAADASCPDVCSKHYPGTPDGRTPTLPFPDPVPGVDRHAFTVEDTVVVPKDIQVSGEGREGEGAGGASGGEKEMDETGK